MEKLLKDNLEEYLDGRLSERQRAEFDACMARNPADRESISRMKRISACFDAFDLPQDAPLAPSPGFHAAVRRRIEEERPDPFWNFLLEPLVVRRVAYAACAWLFLLVSANAFQTSTQDSNVPAKAFGFLASIDRTPTTFVNEFPMPTRASDKDFSQTILCDTAETEAYCSVRLGSDLDTNRSMMLAAVMISGMADWR